MASLAAELSSVVQEAISALEQEDTNDLAGAIDTYYKLKSQLKYVLDMKISPTQDGALGTVCKCLAESYEYRIQASAHCFLLACRLTIHASTACKSPGCQLRSCMLQVLREKQLQHSLASVNACQWLQLEGDNPLHEPVALEGSDLSAAADSMAAMHAQPQHIMATAVAAGGNTVNTMQQMNHRQPGPETTADGGDLVADSLELLRRCQRSVSGSMDDVIGME
jgi:hypothetical protein